MNTNAFSHVPRRGVCLLPLLAGLLFTATTASMLHAGPGWGPSCHGGPAFVGAPCGPVFSPVYGCYAPRGFGYVRPYAHGYGRYYGYGYGAAVPYGFYGGHAYYSPTFGFRSFPYATPRIYVVPRKPPNPYPGPRRIIIYNMGEAEPSEVDGPPPELIPWSEEAAYPPPPPRRQAADPDKAWTYLKEGNGEMALNAFASLATREPEKGVHKLGFGLAAAFSGDKITATYALRRAYDTDPDGVARVRLDKALQDRVAEQGRAYEVALRKDPSNLNLRFLAAAAHHLAREEDQARTLLAESLDRYEDDAPSTRALLRLVDSHRATLDLVQSDPF